MDWTIGLIVAGVFVVLLIVLLIIRKKQKNQ